VEDIWKLHLAAKEKSFFPIRHQMRLVFFRSPNICVRVSENVEKRRNLNEYVVHKRTKSPLAVPKELSLYYFSGKSQ